MTLAIIATAAFAADNLLDFRKASEAAYTPVLDPKLVLARIAGEPKLELYLRNLGRGIAAATEATIWWMDSDLSVWIPYRLEFPTDLLRSGEETVGEIKPPEFRFAFHRHLLPNTPQLVLQIRYRDALRRNPQKFMPYELSKDEEGQLILTDSPHPVPTELTSLWAKQKLLDGELDRVCEEFRLTEIGITIHRRVSRRIIQVQVMRGGQEMWMAQAGIEEPVYQFGKWVRDALPEILANMQDAKQAPREIASPIPEAGERDA